MIDDVKLSPTHFYDTGYEHGWVFGKYTQRVDIDDELLRLLDNDKSSIMQYQDGFNNGFKSGLAERHPQMQTLIF